jgi:hypothetical protein
MAPSTAIVNGSLPVELIPVITSDIPVPLEVIAPIHFVPLDPSIRRSRRSKKGTFSSMKYIEEVYMTSVHLNRNHQDLQLSYLAELLHTNIETGIFNCYDTRK